jgi:hypothetical protein
MQCSRMHTPLNSDAIEDTIFFEVSFLGGAIKSPHKKRCQSKVSKRGDFSKGGFRRTGCLTAGREKGEESFCPFDMISRGLKG